MGNKFCIRTSFFNYLALAVIFIVAIYSRLSVNTIPCANSISCKTPPKYEAVNNATGVFYNRPVRAPNILEVQSEKKASVLGADTSHDKKHIYVNLATQTLLAYEGKSLFLETPISAGLWGKTPKGDFTIWTKVRSTRMTGGTGDDFYDLPNVPYVMFFSNAEVPGSVGFSIHGTYWHNNFGHAMSHGCVNMKTTDVAKLFEWAEGPVDGKEGTTITIYDSESG